MSEPEVRFDHELASRIDYQLTNMETSMSIILRSAEQLYGKIKTERESVTEFPQTSNLDRFINQFEFVFSEKVLRLDKEIEHLRKDWQLKVGTFNQTSGTWEYL
jgi:flagellar biosynthesis chaperone FliJ